jgi:uncharacterized membrane protein
MNRKGINLMLLGVGLMVAQWFLMSFVFMFGNNSLILKIYPVLSLIPIGCFIVGFLMHLYIKFRGGNKEPKTLGSRFANFGLWVAFGPLLVAFIASFVGYLFGCVSGGDMFSTCSLGGSGMANIISTGVMMHWLTLMTIFPGLLIWIAGVFYHRFIIKQRKSSIGALQ